MPPPPATSSPPAIPDLGMSGELIGKAITRAAGMIAQSAQSGEARVAAEPRATASRRRSRAQAAERFEIAAAIANFLAGGLRDPASPPAMECLRAPPLSRCGAIDGRDALCREFPQGCSAAPRTCE